MGTDASREGRRDARMIEVKLRVTNERFSFVDSRLSRSPLGRSLISILNATNASAAQRVGAGELTIGKLETCASGGELRRCLV